MKHQTQETINNHSLGFKDMPVRFFIYEECEETEELEIFECDEQTFLEAEGSIEYERHSVFQNGCKQICLTKNPF